MHAKNERLNSGFPPEIKIVPFYDVVYNGTKLSKDKDVDPVSPDKNDIAIIMFTSGSTGVINYLFINLN
jgi:acyl-coenzyme A synthetase/AMP-(fatty) acid ligase